MIMKKVISEIYCLILLIFSLLSRSRFVVRGNSMLPTFSDSDKFIINRFRYIFFNPKRGDIVCFKANWGINNIYLKRIIGLPGESIELNGNEIYIDGVKYYENYILEIHSTIQSKHLCCKLGNSQYFVLGDNRETNFDSRRFGPVAKKDLIGPTYQICF